MIQEKDFLYRVPVKTAPITTPRGQIRNPEILVDLEGGEFMHGNILDANSTNKLISQSVKDAVDDKFIESVHVTKDLLEAETSARTKGDEDLSAKIKAEQTRSEGKEKEISDKLAIVDGDSNTEGSFRKAIADVIAAAPEDLDTLKEIADKLAGNDDLHTELNRAITEKADASALANEVSRATGAESNLQAAIGTKQDAGNYIPYDDQYKQVYIPDRTLRTRGNNIEAYSNGSGNDRSILQPGNILVEKTDGNRTHTAKLNIEGLTIRNAYKDIYIDEDGFRIFDATGNNGFDFIIQKQGITLKGGDNSHVLTSNSGTIDITQYALKTELPTVPTKTSQLTNDSNFIAVDNVDDNNYTLQRGLKIGNEADGYSTIGKDGITVGNREEGFDIDEIGIRGRGIHTNCSYSIDGVNITNYSKTISIDPDQIVSSADEIISFLIEPNNITLGDINNPNVKISSEGIKFANKSNKEIPTADGTFIVVDDFASIDDVSSLRAGLSKKQNKITVNEVDITDIETADITKLRTIVINLINALSASDLIRRAETIK